MDKLLSYESDDEEEITIPRNNNDPTSTTTPSDLKSTDAQQQQQQPAYGHYYSYNNADPSRDGNTCAQYYYYNYNNYHSYQHDQQHLVATINPKKRTIRSDEGATQTSSSSSNNNNNSSNMGTNCPFASIPPPAKRYISKREKAALMGETATAPVGDEQQQQQQQLAIPVSEYAPPQRDELLLPPILPPPTKSQQELPQKAQHSANIVIDLSSIPYRWLEPYLKAKNKNKVNKQQQKQQQLSSPSNNNNNNVEEQQQQQQQQQQQPGVGDRSGAAHEHEHDDDDGDDDGGDTATEKRLLVRRKKLRCDIPKKHSFDLLPGHKDGVNCIRWSKRYGQFLASASMDKTAKIWDVLNSRQCLLDITSHTGAVKDVQFNSDSTRIISGGFDKAVLLTDTQTGQPIRLYKHNEFITALKFHPLDDNLFMAGLYSSGVACWDIRVNKVIKEYNGKFGEIQDIEFMPGGASFLTSTTITRRNSTDKSIIVWDFDSTVQLSSQIYMETYTCPCVKVHPTGTHFVAQSNGNYIAIFDCNKPYRMNKRKRFEGHQVGGYHIMCSFSPDGRILTTGSADGSIFFYDWASAKIEKRIQAHSRVCMDVRYHPILPTMVASCSWDGTISIFE